MSEYKYYIAGPMTGIPYFNFPAFDKAKKFIEDNFAQNEIFSPADHDRALLGKPNNWLPKITDSDGAWKFWSIPNAPELRRMLGDDLAWIAKNATDIYMLKGWENSRGAGAEWALARALGLRFHYQ